MSIQYVDSIPTEMSHDLSMAYDILSLGPSQHPAAFEADNEFHDYSWLDAHVSSTFKEGEGYKYIGNYDALRGYGRWLGYESTDHFIDAIGDALDARDEAYEAELAAELAAEGIYLNHKTPDIYAQAVTDTNNQTVLINTEGY